MNYRVKEFLNFEGEECNLEKKSMLISPYDARLVIKYFESKQTTNLFPKQDLEYIKEMIEEYTGLFKYKIDDIKLVNPLLYKVCMQLVKLS